MRVEGLQFVKNTIWEAQKNEVGWNCLRSVVLQLGCASESAGRLVQTMLALHPEFLSDAAEMRWSLRIYIPNKFPGDAAAAAADTETTLRITGGLNKLLHL